jgi:PKD repeat protein
MVGDPGEYTVTLTVENAFGSDTYQYSLHVVEGLDLQVLEIRIRLEGATNTLVEDPNYGTDRFRTRIGEGTAEGEAYASDSAHGYLDAIKYLHIPEDLMYGHDQAPPEGQADAFEATLSYLSTRLDWRISCAGYEPEELFTHDPFEEAGHLRGYFGAVEDIYIVDAWLPEGILGVPSEPVEVTIALDVTEAG